MSQINFKTTPDEHRVITKIVDRGLAMLTAAGGQADAFELSMDITATHANGCPLKLDKLLAADDSNFAHDFFGIRRHLDRTTGHLTNCFLPRYHA